jgi:hypothetical protein
MLQATLRLTDEDGTVFTYPCKVDPNESPISVELGQALNDVLDLASVSNVSLEVVSNGKVADASVELEMDAVFLSKKAYQRLIAK